MVNNCITLADNKELNIYFREKQENFLLELRLSFGREPHYIYILGLDE